MARTGWANCSWKCALNLRVATEPAKVQNKTKARASGAEGRLAKEM